MPRLEGSVHWLLRCADPLAHFAPFGRVKNYDKVLTRIGRLRQRDSRVARYYDIRIEKDATNGNATILQWTRIVPPEDTLPGVDCLRTNQAQWDEATLWHTYPMLTDREAVFRSLRCLGRPVGGGG
ncbi:MAG: hypothetical protein ACFCVA_11405 [Gammaproteobacteria bacterium]